MTVARRLTRLPSLMTMTGGVLLAAGAVTPWLEFYGGLHGYPGIAGLWGKLLLVGGVFAIVLTIVAAASRSPIPGVLIIALGLASGVLGATRLHHASALVNNGDALMLVPSLGPGLAVVILGSLAVACGGWGTVTESRARHRRLMQPCHPR